MIIKVLLVLWIFIFIFYFVTGDMKGRKNLNSTESDNHFFMCRQEDKMPHLNSSPCRSGSVQW